MDGTHKKVRLESQLLIANNLNRPITVYVSDVNMKSYLPQDSMRATIEPDEVFRVPITWIYSKK